MALAPCWSCCLRYGLGHPPAHRCALLGVVCFNFSFPAGASLHIANPQNWVALAAFLITALTAGALWARAKRRAEEPKRAGARSNACTMNTGPPPSARDRPKYSNRANG